MVWLIFSSLWTIFLYMSNPDPSAREELKDIPCIVQPCLFKIYLYVHKIMFFKKSKAECKS